MDMHNLIAAFQQCAPEFAASYCIVNGYYEHCRRRYDLVLAEPEKLKNFIGTEEKIFVHMLFLSSKPIEMEFQDKDEVVTCLSLGIFEKYITGKLISGETDEVMRPVKIL